MPTGERPDRYTSVSSHLTITMGSTRARDRAGGRSDSQGDGNRQPDAGQLFRRRTHVRSRRGRRPCAAGSPPRGPTCSIWGANPAGREPSRLHSRKSCAGSSRSSRRSRAAIDRPALDRYHQGRGRPAGARGRRRHHQRHLRAGADPEMARVAADTGAGVVLMHMQGTPATMQHEPRITTTS